MTKTQARSLLNKLEGIRKLLGDAHDERNIGERNLLNFKARVEIMEIMEIIDDTYLKPRKLKRSK